MKKLFSVVAVMGLATLGGNLNSDLEQRFDRNKELSSSPINSEKPQTILNPDGSKMYFAPIVIVSKPRGERNTFGFIGLKEGRS